jgi:nicotinamide-nucleotide amidase
MILGHLIFGEGEITLQQKIASILSANRKTLATSESCTGGNISRLLTEIPGSSFFFKGSIVAYSNELKQNLLNVQKKVLDEFGAVSEEVIIQMASNLRENLKTDYAIATSGIAGPDGGTSKKPIGTTWIACASKEGVQTKLLQLSNERLANIELASISALDLLRRTLLQNEASK